MIFLLTLIAADVNFIAVDVHTRQVVERQWTDAEQPVPVGSLVKPFSHATMAPRRASVRLAA